MTDRELELLMPAIWRESRRALVLYHVHGEAASPADVAQVVAMEIRRRPMARVTIGLVARVARARTVDHLRHVLGRSEIHRPTTVGLESIAERQAPAAGRGREEMEEVYRHEAMLTPTQRRVLRALIAAAGDHAAAQAALGMKRDTYWQHLVAIRATYADLRREP